MEKKLYVIGEALIDFISQDTGSRYAFFKRKSRSGLV